MDCGVLDRLVEYGEISMRDTVLEVGAGTGELTWRIAARAGKVIAVEIDERLALEARRRLAGYRNVELLIGDILKTDVGEFNKVVSNPPYQISTKLIHRLLTSLPEKIVLTLQREFAHKLISKPGERKYVYTSFLAGLLYRSEIVEEVPRNAFKPMPRVDSVIVVMDRLGDLNPRMEELSIVKMLFTQKMKRLRSAVRSVSARIGLDPYEAERSLPPETLSRRVYCLSPLELYGVASTLTARLRRQA